MVCFMREEVTIWERRNSVKGMTLQGDLCYLASCRFLEKYKAFAQPTYCKSHMWMPHLAMQGTWVQSLVREVRSNMLWGNEAHVPGHVP